MKIVTILGTRPEIIKMSPLLDLLNNHFEHIIVHSGQHYDPNLDKELFKELKLPQPKVRLKTGSGSFAQQFARQIKELYKVLSDLRPDFAIVQGDTNTALSGAIVAARLNIKVLHIEAGCRSGNIRAPEEQNRILIDSVAYKLFCADKKAYENLLNEKKGARAVLVGSTTFDAIERSSKLPIKSRMAQLKLRKGQFILATLHRAENMENLKEFQQKIEFLNWVSQFMPVVFPIHPRTQKFLRKNSLKLEKNIIQTGPMNHLSFVDLLKNGRLVISDSGGIQEEAAFFNRPCLVLRKETEWTRLIDAGKNFLFQQISKKEMDLTKRLIQDDKFYKRVQTKKCAEVKAGAAAKIIKEIKRLSR